MLCTVAPRKVGVLVRTFDWLFLLFSGQFSGMTRKGFYGRSLRLQPDMGVVLQHLLGDVTGNGHDDVIGMARLGKGGNRAMPEIVESKSL